MWMREHQRPWTLGAIVAADANDLKRTLLDRLETDRYRRAWLVVGGDRGYWREERLCLRRGGTWAFVVDSHRGPAEPRNPAHPELIPELEQRVREIIEEDSIPECTLHVSKPGLLLLGADVDAGTLFGLAGYRDVLELFWRIRVQTRLARGTAI
jgi:hypothetical protein